MTHSIIIKKSDGLPFNNLIYHTDYTPPDDAIPNDCTLIFITPTMRNYELAYAMFIDDPLHISSEYIPYSLGGAVYNFNTQEFEFLKVLPVNLAELIRDERNRLLAAADIYAMVPDYPEPLHQAVLEYRSALRDLPDNLDPEWTKFEDVVWPKIPDHLIDF